MNGHESRNREALRRVIAEESNDRIIGITRPRNFIGKAYVTPASSETNPDAYLVIDTETAGLSAVINIGSKSDVASLETLAEDLNKWARTFPKEGITA